MATTKLKMKNCSECAGTGTVPADDVGPVLREAREKAGLLQKDVAEYMGISPTYIFDLETGRRPWTNEQVGSYQRALVELANGN